MASAVAAAVVVVVALGVVSPVPVSAASSARPFGSQPLSDVFNAASAAVNCGLNANELSAMMLAPTFPESGASSGNFAPSPMTLSRGDTVARNANNANLYAFKNPNTPYQRAFFHPGIGMWQMDSAGLGSPRSADQWINTATVAPVVAVRIATAYCNAAGTPDVRRAAAWGPWNGCRVNDPNPANRTCENIFNEIYDATTGQLRNLTQFDNVGRTGGMEFRRCQPVGRTEVVDCGYVNPSAAQGATWWTNPNINGATPISLPFYVYTLDGREYRHWLPADTNYDVEIMAWRPLGTNARTNLTWTSGPSLCDLTFQRGSCVADPPLGAALAPMVTDRSMAGPGLGVGFSSAGVSSRPLAERRSDGNVRITSLTDTGWTGWTYLGGAVATDPDIVSSAPGRYDVVAVGPNRVLYHAAFINGVFTGWTDLGGEITSAPTIAAWGGGRFDIFGRGTDGAIWSRYFDGNYWSDWYSWGGQSLADPEVASWGVNRLDVVVVGTDRGLWHRAWLGNGLSSWQPLGGSFTSAPAVTSSALNRLELFGRGTNSVVFVNRWTGAAYTGWTSLGGVVQGAPDAALRAGSTVDVVARGSNGLLYRNSVVSGVGTGWAPVP